MLLKEQSEQQCKPSNGTPSRANKQTLKCDIEKQELVCVVPRNLRFIKKSCDFIFVFTLRKSFNGIVKFCAKTFWLYYMLLQV